MTMVGGTLRTILSRGKKIQGNCEKRTEVGPGELMSLAMRRALEGKQKGRGDKKEREDKP
jgi:hypothetical protein